MMNRTWFLSCAALVATVAGPPAGATPPVVHSEAPARPQRTITLQELWRVGGEDDPHVFGTLIDARTDAAGNVYLLDQQLSRVSVLSPDGAYLTELGGEGDGPGECRQPQTLVVFDDGAVGLGQRFPGRFVKVTPTGEPVGSVDLGGAGAVREGFTMLVTACNRGGTLLVGSLHQVPGENGQSRQASLVRLASTGEELVRYAEQTTFLDFRKAHFVEREMSAPFLEAQAVGPDGRVYFAPQRDAYRIEVRAPDGTCERIISRTFDHPQRDQQTLDRIDALFAEQDRALPFRITWEVEPRDQAVSELRVASDNCLWVRHAGSDRDRPDGVLTRYDVFAPDGRWLEELNVQAPGDPAHDGLIFLDDDRVLLVKGLVLARLTASGTGGAVTGETGGAWAIEVVCCRIAG